MTKAQIFSATPTPAEDTTSMPLMIIWMTRKEMPTNRSCSPTGIPSRNSVPMTSRSKRMW